MSDAAESTALLQALSNFGVKLAESDLAIYGVAYDFMHFGSWTIEVGNRHRRQLVQWDGKEGLLSISKAQVSDSQAPKDWQPIFESKVPDTPTNSGIFAFALDRILATADA